MSGTTRGEWTERPRNLPPHARLNLLRHSLIRLLRVVGETSDDLA